jgi:O-antigen ligase
VIAVGVLFRRTYKHSLPNLLLGLSLLPLLKGMVATGSRSGIATAVIGCLAYVFSVRQAKRKILSVAALAVGLSLSLYFAAANSVLSERWQKAYYNEDFSGRGLIYPTAVQMALERPLFGWGPVNHWYELGRRTGNIFNPRDEHNLILFLLLEVGLVGTVPVLLGIGLIARAAWRARRGTLGFLPLAILCAVAANNMIENGLGLHGKLFWLMMALAAASPNPVPMTRPMTMRRNGQR